jgi:hypothetical protein
MAFDCFFYVGPRFWCIACVCICTCYFVIYARHEQRSLAQHGLDRIGLDWMTWIRTATGGLIGSWAGLKFCIRSTERMGLADR